MKTDMYSDSITRLAAGLLCPARISIYGRNMRTKRILFYEE